MGGEVETGDYVEVVLVVWGSLRNMYGRTVGKDFKIGFSVIIDGSVGGDVSRGVGYEVCWYVDG